MLNRSALIVKAKQPFLKWLCSLPDPAKVTLKELNWDSTLYLLPEYTFESEEEEILAHYFDLIFEEELSGWWTNEADWPADRGLDTFKKWFDFEFQSMIVDIVDAPLTDEE
jgi:hypothetical protein